MTANPEQPVWSLSLLREDERERLLNEWNDTRTEYPRTSPVHELYEAQAAAHPGKVAVTFGEQQVTYGELNERANRLAHHLRARGVAAEVRVGVCLERSVDLIVSLLAILKAGGAYVPLDPSYPEQRLAFMAGDAGVSVLITQPHLRPRLADVDAQIICLSGDAAEIARHHGAQPPHGQVTADNLAYVMYTSGSTGQPKGVGITHRNVVRLVKGTDYADFNADEVFLQLAPVSFDASTFEIWGSLLNGGRLVVMPPQTPTLEELGEALRRYEVTTLWLTAGLFHQMADQQLAALNGVRQLLAGGDALSVVHVGKTLAERGTGCLINGYGPTETTTFACCYRMHSGDEIGRSVPIGRPIANTTVYVLDGEMQGVPVGVAGELYIGGDGVGRGYLNDAELTAQRFVPHPFSDAPGERLYRTGDRVRYLDDGRIEFLGRLDEQVKLRGYRIEVGEIEAALDEHPAVGKSVVQMISAASGDKRLIAYAAWVDAPPTARELRGYLRSRLPEYMIPSQFVLLEELP
ncbi:MAG TPA: amino acid adenylation domain-containing protein, partial [Pyrinomonadaceae bacterium]|nr:amino acid adenylation domain-containing protein [Pyrinomonadaceae bacterium]